MRTTVYAYEFKAEIKCFGVGKTRKVWCNVRMLPQELKHDLPFDEYPRLRVDGKISDVPITNAVLPTGAGRVFVTVSPDVIKFADVTIGDAVQMRFAIADQDAVDVLGLLEQL